MLNLRWSLRWKALALAIALLAGGQLYHLLKYGDLISYGCRVEVARVSVREEKYGGEETAYISWLSNYTVHSLPLEALMDVSDTSPFRDIPSAVHSRIDKWDEHAHAWVTVRDSGWAGEKSGWAGYHIGVVHLRPFQSDIGEVGPLAHMDGFKKGDKVRFVFLTSFTKPEGDPGVRAFYSAPFVIRE